MHERLVRFEESVEVEIGKIMMEVHARRGTRERKPSTDLAAPVLPNDHLEPFHLEVTLLQQRNERRPGKRVPRGDIVRIDFLVVSLDDCVFGVEQDSRLHEQEPTILQDVSDSREAQLRVPEVIEDAEEDHDIENLCSSESRS